MGLRYRVDRRPTHPRLDRPPQLTLLNHKHVPLIRARQKAISGRPGMVGEILARCFAADQVEALEGIFLEAPQFEEALTRGHELDVVERREVYAADLV